MTLTSPPIAARETERKLQELLDEWVRAYFTGTPHTTKLGDVTFPVAQVLFNQTQIDDPTDVPQIHFVFSGMRATESWWANGRLSEWSATLANPASGVYYGTTPQGIEEAVHGKLARLIPDATDIRWLIADDTLREEAFIAGTWELVRSFPGVDALRWVRQGGSYAEQTRDALTHEWADARVITITNPTWDGTKKLVVIDGIILCFVRTINKGQSGEQGEYAARKVADNLREIITDEESRSLLIRRGFRRFRVAGGPTSVPSSGHQTKLLQLEAQLRYFVPKLH